MVLYGGGFANSKLTADETPELKLPQFTGRFELFELGLRFQ